MTEEEFLKMLIDCLDCNKITFEKEYDEYLEKMSTCLYVKVPNAKEYEETHRRYLITTETA